MAEHKITRSLCEKCKYRTYFSAVGIFDKKWPASVACGYNIATGESRVFKDGGYRHNYRPGYCQVFEEKK